MYHSDTRALWKRFDNDAKRTTHMFEGIFIDPFDNENPSDHPLNFVCSDNIFNHENSTKSLRQRQSSINKLQEEAFDIIRKQHATKKLLRPTFRV